jgi:agmatine/peptidylarginine deiminase
MAQKSTPREGGFVMPAEFEPHEGCWIAWPSRPDIFKENCRPAQIAFTNVINGIFKKSRVIFVEQLIQTNSIFWQYFL